ncbi:hypothetical protein DYBT9275_02308 [Dyadobacter sp. CECT 9275]|uniref:Uncharacterized protein n=1 Tax=Dyadobacter helix TaxID=2822344 RepID=A0A916JCC6_9BACT|nr:hypothetical protein DYBT9275_02308 [Dyadobacter sp. CECT 9275]
MADYYPITPKHSIAQTKFALGGLPSIGINFILRNRWSFESKWRFDRNYVVKSVGAAFIT